MKELIIGMGLGFIVGAITVRNNKNFAEKVDAGIEKGKEIIGDISDEIKSQTKQKNEN